MNAADLVARADRLRGEVSRRKAIIRQQRSALATAAAELDRLERECARLGIRLTVVSQETRPDATHRPDRPADHA